MLLALIFAPVVAGLLAPPTILSSQKGFRELRPLTSPKASLTDAVAINTVLAATGIAAKQKSLTPSGLANSWLLGVVS